VVTRDLNLRKILPLPMLILIFFHFGWYLVELFNPSSINLFAAFAGTKVYIFPFFLFVYFRKNEADFDGELLPRLKSECFGPQTELHLREYFFHTKGLAA
jgi:hypothetical protein